MGEYILITFESTNFAMQAEASLKNENIIHQVMPTPREITLSCGLSIRFSVDDVDKVRKLVDENRINVKNMYRVKGTGSGRIIELINKTL